MGTREMAAALLLITALAPAVHAQGPETSIATGDDVCGDIGEQVRVGDEGVAASYGDPWNRFDLDEVRVRSAAAEGGGVDVTLHGCVPVRVWHLGGERAAVATLQDGCVVRLAATEPLQSAAGGGPPVGRFTKTCPLPPPLYREVRFDVELPASAVAVDGRDVRVRVTRATPGLPAEAHAALAPGIVWEELHGMARPTASHDLGVFYGSREAIVNPGGRTDFTSYAEPLLLR